MTRDDGGGDVERSQSVRRRKVENSKRTLHYAQNAHEPVGETCAQHRQTYVRVCTRDAADGITARDASARGLVRVRWKTGRLFSRVRVQTLSSITGRNGPGAPTETVSLLSVPCVRACKSVRRCRVVYSHVKTGAGAAAAVVHVGTRPRVRRSVRAGGSGVR